MVSDNVKVWLNTLVANGVFNNIDYAAEAILYCAKRIMDLSGLDYDTIKSWADDNASFPLSKLNDYGIIRYNIQFSTPIENGLGNSGVSGTKYNGPITNISVPALSKKPTADSFDMNTWLQELVDNGIFTDTELAENSIITMAYQFCIAGNITMDILVQEFGSIFPIGNLDDVEGYIQKFIQGTLFEVRYDQQRVARNLTTKYGDKKNPIPPQPFPKPIKKGGKK